VEGKNLVVNRKANLNGTIECDCDNPIEIKVPCVEYGKDRETIPVSFTCEKCKRVFGLFFDPIYPNGIKKGHWGIAESKVRLARLQEEETKNDF